MSVADIFADETGKRSAARVFLALWLANILVYVWLVDVPQPGVLTLFTAIAVPLVMWAAGPRIAAAIGPGLAGAVQAVSNAKIFQRRSDDGTERTP